MNSDLPKVLAQACGRHLIDYVLDALERAGIHRHLVVVGYRGDEVRKALCNRNGIQFAEQTELRGTGHAVMMCRSQLQDFSGPVVVVTGDSPMLQSASLERLLAEFREHQASCVLGTLKHDRPDGLGRIVRDEAGQFLGIVEEKDATAAQRLIREVNMSTYVFDCQTLLPALDRLTNQNRQREYYITDVPAIMLAAGGRVRALPVLHPCEAFSVNTIEDLGRVEAEIRRIQSDTSNACEN